MIHVCKVCKTLDNDNSLKDCFWCAVCKSWICQDDKYRLDRRIRAMRIAKIKTVLALILMLGIKGYSVIPAENINHSVTLKWGRPPGSYDGFNIYRADTCHGFIYLKKVGLVYRFVDQAAIGGETYTYVVRSTLKGVESIDSPIGTTTVPY